MKRYEPIEVVGPDGDDVAMEERPDGQWYHRADLIAAGCLVPVPDGEACELAEIGRGQKFLFAEYGVCEVANPGRYDRTSDVRVLSTGEIITSEKYGVRVQRVRLVRLEDAG